MHKSKLKLKDLLTYNIKYFRYVRGYSQEKLAELCNLSSRYLTDIERGKHCPTIDKIDLIANALGIAPYELFKDFDRDPSIVKKMKNARQYNQN